MGLLLIRPNFSEGRRPEVVEALARALGSAPGLKLLALASDPRDNRTVITAAGPPEAVVAGVLRAAAAAVRLIDLRVHRGAHPRMGALDVVPVEPLAGSTLAGAVAVVRAVGEALAREIGLPVYYYGAGTARTLEEVRAGEFEGLAERMRAPAGAPDAGPIQPHPTAGATAVGARQAPLWIVLRLRGGEQGLEETAERLRTLPGVRGVQVRDGVLQVTLDDWEATPLPALARAAGDGELEVDGLVPLQALLPAIRAGTRLAVAADQVPEWLYWAGEG